MERFDVEAGAELRFGFVTEFANGELANLVSKCLSGPGDVTIGLGLGDGSFGDPAPYDAGGVGAPPVPPSAVGVVSDPFLAIASFTRAVASTPGLAFG